MSRMSNKTGMNQTQPGVDLQVINKDYVLDLVENLDKKYSKGQSIVLKEALDKTFQKVQSKVIILIEKFIPNCK